MMEHDREEWSRHSFPRDEDPMAEYLRAADSIIVSTKATVAYGAGAIPLCGLYAIIDALDGLTFEEFDDALASAFGSRDTSYARGVWSPYKNNPVWFLKSRSPQTQAEAIFAAAMRKMASNSTRETK